MGNIEQFAPLAFVAVAICGVSFFLGWRDEKKKDAAANNYGAEKRAKADFWEDITRINRDHLTPGILDSYARSSRPMSYYHAIFPWLAHHIERMEMGNPTEFGQR